MQYRYIVQPINRSRIAVFLHRCLIGNHTSYSLHKNQCCPVHTRASLGQPEKLKTIFDFPIIEWDFRGKLSMQFLCLFRDKPFDEVEFARGVVISMTFVSNCIKKGITKPFAQRYGATGPIGLHCILNHIAEGLNNPHHAAAYNIKESDIVRIQYHGVCAENTPEFGADASNCSIKVQITYIQGFEKKLQDSFHFKPKENSPMDLESMKKMRENILEHFKKDQCTATYFFGRVYKDGKLRKPVSDWQIVQFQYNMKRKT